MNRRLFVDILLSFPREYVSHVQNRGLLSVGLNVLTKFSIELQKEKKIYRRAEQSKRERKKKEDESEREFTASFV